jgi:hypothetical protein
MARFRFTIITLVIALALPAAGALAGTTLYRSVDSNGVPRYSDRPSPGAQKIVVNPTAAAPGAAEQPSAAPAPSGPPAAPPETPVRYSLCEITAPEDDRVFFAEDSVSVSLRVEPDLQPCHAGFLLYDGARVGGAGLNFTISPVFRGTHSLVAGVQDSGGRPLCQSKTVTFHMRQPSLLQPNRPGGSKP